VRQFQSKANPAIDRHAKLLGQIDQQVAEPLVIGGKKQISEPAFNPLSSKSHQFCHSQPYREVGIHQRLEPILRNSDQRTGLDGLDVFVPPVQIEQSKLSKDLIGLHEGERRYFTFVSQVTDFGEPCGDKEHAVRRFGGKIDGTASRKCSHPTAFFKFA
jgi:hypothetical protein